MVQDVRHLTGFWSKGSRGASVASVHLFGFTDDEVETMRTPLSIAAQGAEIEVVGSPTDASYDALRHLLLSLLRDIAPRAKDLSLRLPPRKRRVAAFAGLGLAILCAIGVELHAYWSSRVSLRRGEIEAWLLDTEGLDAAQAKRAEFDEASASLGATMSSLEQLSDRGISIRTTQAEKQNTPGD